MTPPRLVGLTGAIVLLLATAGCGSRLAHDRVVADWGASGSSPSALAPGAATGVTPTSTVPTTGPTARAGVPVRGQRPAVLGSGGGPTRTVSTSLCAGTGTIKLGNVAPYSATAVGSSYRPLGDAVQVWQADVNARGGICGRKVQVIQRDDKGSTSENAAQVKDLVENEHVVAFVAQGTALTLEGSRSYLEQHHVAVFGGDMLSMQWSGSPALFPAGLGFDELIYQTLRSTQPFTHGNNKVALLYCAEAQACADGKRLGVDEGIAKKAGVQVVYSKQTSLTAISFASECQAAHDAGAGTIFLGGDASFIERVANSCGQQGLSFEYTSAIGGSAAQADNQYLNNHFHLATQVFAWAASSTAAQQRYQAAWHRYYPQLDNSGASAVGWVSGLLAEHVLGLLGSQVPTAQNVWDTAHTKVKGFTADGLTGPLTFRPGGQQSPRCGGFADIVDGAWVARDKGALTCRSGAPLL